MSGWGLVACFQKLLLRSQFEGLKESETVLKSHHTNVEIKNIHCLNRKRVDLVALGGVTLAGKIVTDCDLIILNYL